MRILVTMALQQEFAGWRTAGQFSPVRVDGVELFRSNKGEVEVDVVLSGIGNRNGRCLEFMRSSFSASVYSVCISAGLAGGLNPALRSGTVVTPRECGCPASHEPKSDSALSCDGEWHQLAISCGAQAIQRLLTTKVPVNTSADKSRLANWADAVDMESFEIVREASVRAIPAVVIRAISDAHDFEMPYDFAAATNAQGQMSIPKLARQVIVRPAGATGLLRLGKESVRAVKNMHRVLETFIAQLAVHNQSLPSAAEEVTAT